MKHIRKIDFVVIFVTVSALIFLVGYINPKVIAPLDELETVETNILFSIDNAERILIDDNIDFTTPEEYFIGDGLKINLEPGTYYWKAVGLRTSEIRTLTIKSLVSLELRESEEGFDVVNSGNVRLNVDIYNGSDLVESIKLKKGEEAKSFGDKFVGWFDG